MLHVIRFAAGLRMISPWTKPRGMIAAGILAAAIMAAPARAEDFYAGKTIDLIVSNAPGGGFDIYARTLAQHLTHHLPGSPAVVVKNMPGAGGARAGHYVSAVAAKDGLTIGAIMPGTIMAPLLDDKPDTSFDPSKAVYLGTANTGTYICVTFEHSKTKTFEQALTQKTIMGGIAPGNSVNDIANLVKTMTGAQFDLVAGYKGTVDVALAIERGELDGACGWNWSSLKSQKPDWIANHRLNYLAQIALEPNPELTRLGAPEIWRFIRDEESRKVAEVVISQQAFERPYFAAPGTPTERVGALRAAFDATLRDPQFLADAGRIGMDVSPMGGDELQQIVRKLYDTPKPVLDRAKRAIRP
jgi:tripartite-type tricarboxylate transporter receptor subunit TctC